MKDIAIYGAGGLGREIYCIIKRINWHNPTWNVIGFFDDGKKKGSHNEYGEILGGIDDLNHWSSPLSVCFAIGEGKTISKIYSKITNSQIDFPNILLYVDYSDKNNVCLGKGNVILDTHLSCAVKIGDFNFMNGGVSLGHDVEIGDFNTIMPDVRISGEVTIGNWNYFGIGTIVIQRLRIGDNVRLAAGSVLMTKPKDNQLYIGNPAKLFRY